MVCIPHMQSLDPSLPPLKEKLILAGMDLVFGFGLSYYGASTCAQAKAFLSAIKVRHQIF